MATAIAVGLFWVNGPVLFLLISPIVLLDVLVTRGVLSPSQNWLVIPFFAVGFVLAWLWWSVTVPKWRLWAYERVSDIPRLKWSATTVGLTWSDGNWFNRTEIKSRAHALREKELDPEMSDIDEEKGA